MLGRCADATVPGRDLVKQVNVRHRILDVALEVIDLAPTPGPLQVEVDPADEDLFGGESHELLQGLAFTEEGRQVGVVVEVDVS